MNEFILITFAILADVMFPGPNFILCSSIAINFGYKKAFELIAGIILGCIFWCVFLIFGITILFAEYPLLKNAIQLVGGIYLLFLGFKMLIASINNKDILSLKIAKYRNNQSNNFKTRFKVFSIGFINCLFNPEVGLFYMVMFTRVIDVHGINYLWLFIYSLDFIFIQLICFIFIALCFAKMKNQVLRYLRYLNFGLSLILLYLAMKLLIKIF